MYLLLMKFFSFLDLWLLFNFYRIPWINVQFVHVVLMGLSCFKIRVIISSIISHRSLTIHSLSLSLWEQQRQDLREW